MTKNVKQESAPLPNETQKLLQQIGGENGPLGPLVRQLCRLMEDPILKQVMDSIPPGNMQKH